MSGECRECEGSGFVTEFDGIEEYETHRCWACDTTAEKRADNLPELPETP